MGGYSFAPSPTGGGFAYYADVWLSTPTNPNNWTLVQSPKPWLLYFGLYIHHFNRWCCCILLS